MSTGPTPRQLSIMAERFPSLRGAPGVRPWESTVLARHVWDSFYSPIKVAIGKPDPAAMAMAATCILLRAEDGLVDTREQEHIRLKVDPVDAVRWWDEAHWLAFIALPRHLRRLR